MPSYDLFISYSHINRNVLVDPLIQALQAQGVRVWYDKFEIKTGDSITDKINEGLREARFGLIVISKDYIQSNWARQELNAFFKKQITLSQKHVLPLWYQVTLQDLFDYFPLLSDYRAIQIQHTDDIPDAVSQIMEVVRDTRYPDEEIPAQVEPVDIPKDTPPDSVRSADEIKAMVEEGNIDHAIQTLKQFNHFSKQERLTLSMLSSRFHTLTQERDLGTVSSESFHLKLNQLVLSLLKLL